MNQIFAIAVEADETDVETGETTGYTARADYEHVPDVHGGTPAEAVEGLSEWLPGGDEVQPDDEK